MLSSLLEGLFLHEISRVDFRTISFNLEIDFEPLFHLPRIDTIYIASTIATRQFLRKVGDRSIDDPSCIPLPGLKNLSLIEVNLNGDLEAVKPGDLVSFLDSRKSMGVEIQMLLLAGCSMRERDTEELKPLCQVLEVSDRNYEDD